MCTAVFNNNKDQSLGGIYNIHSMVVKGFIAYDHGTLLLELHPWKEVIIDHNLLCCNCNIEKSTYTFESLSYLWQQHTCD